MIKYGEKFWQDFLMIFWIAVRGRTEVRTRTGIQKSAKKMPKLPPPEGFLIFAVLFG